MRAIFIRHGESTGNAGIPCNDLALKDLGWRQASEVAASWTETPDLIVTSPYLRTQQTAAPTIERFPEVPLEVWPIQEFTYLQPSRWNGTLSSERMQFIERYWAQCRSWVLGWGGCRKLQDSPRESAGSLGSFADRVAGLHI